MQRLILGLFTCGLLAVGGCGGYATPSPEGVANTAALEPAQTLQTDAGIGDALKLSPLAHLPTAIAVVRVQRSPDGAGFSVVSMRDVEKPQLLDHLRTLPMVRGIAPISSMMLPQNPGYRDLRQAAAGLHADMLLIYTLDVTSHVDDALLPLSTVTLGLSPNEVANASCTASAVLMDTRNGYLYASMEAHDQKQQLASAWTSTAATEAAVSNSEQAAFEQLAAQMELTWKGVVAELRATSPAAP